MRRMMAVLLLVGVSPVSADPGQIEVFVTTGTTVSTTPADRRGIPVEIHHVDAVDRATEALSQGLPADPDAAAAIAQERLDAQAHRDLEAAYEPLLRAYRLNIEQVPAIVFDGQAVVYGTTDLARGLREYERWRQ